MNDTETTTTAPRPGRFRLWESQHEKLKDVEGVYYFLVDGKPTTRVTPETVDIVMQERGINWSNSGPGHEKGNQAKIIWSYLIDPE